MPLLEIKNLQVEFVTDTGPVPVVNGLSLTVEAGETVCLVGESGCGKTVTALSIARLVPTPPAHYPGGEIWLSGRDVLRMSPRELRQIRGGMVGYVFQEPSASLNPVMRVGRQIWESLKIHRSQTATNAEVTRLLRLVGIPEPEVRRHDYPHQLSGGMQQRVMIAMALASNPALLIADEPTSALDVTIQIQILDLLNGLVRQFRNAVLLITHAMGVAAFFSDKIAVMYAGNVVEFAPTATLFARPAHPYTQGLLQAVPRIGFAGELAGIPGTVPDLVSPPSGCRFHPRCPHAMTSCSERMPALREIAPAHHVACFLHGEER